ncbi:uncharacterized protein IUM83_02368 [Phytophthora cinnamomi]|uniref:uncharacterized protein n=1 Tax=Phytophthora cinnamomi TaxID=4785 RepID=UPI00355AB2EA|nr:hypothetical protein IUM83_02368 [Phytophthora cinnamomi]
MAFLATEDRFGPDLDRYRQGEPNPCTYTPENDEVLLPAQELHLALGPGSYKTNQEIIATPFTFSHEKRHGILDNTAALGRVGCSPGPALYRVESSTAVPSVSTVASAPFRSKHAAAFITRVRSDSQLHQQQKKDAALYSKELAKSYQELGASVQRLGNRLASPELREQTFRRFDKDLTAVEAYRHRNETRLLDAWQVVIY